MNTDAELLHRFVVDRSEAAFTELVHRYLSLVRATALRRVGGDVHAASDITQQVFVSLARKASSLRGHTTIAGWLYVSAHHASAEFVRREQRRKQREAAAHSMHLTDSSPEQSADIARLRPLLDDALINLKPDEREVIVLRFFSERTFSEIGKAVQLSEEAARKRVDRALEKVHAMLVRRGVTSSVAALGVALTAAGQELAPAGLAIRVAGAALTEAAASKVALSAASVLWPVAASAVLMGGTLVLFPQHRANAEAAAALATRESETRASIAALKDEKDQLARELLQASTAPVRVETAANPPAAQAANPSAPAGMSVVVSPEGTLLWEGKPVTLDQFLANLASYQASVPNGESQLVVNAKGAHFPHLNYVLEEARKAGITHLVVESDAQPEGARNTWF